MCLTGRGVELHSKKHKKGKHKGKSEAETDAVRVVPSRLRQLKFVSCALHVVQPHYSCDPNTCVWVCGCVGVGGCVCVCATCRGPTRM